MRKVTPSPIDLAKADAKLRAWREKYNTSKKVAVLHRKSILKRVAESMAFEGQPVSMARLKALLKEKGRSSHSHTEAEQE